MSRVLTFAATEPKLFLRDPAGVIVVAACRKDTPRPELCRAVRAAARGESVLSPAVAAVVLGRLRTPKTSDDSGPVSPG
ncbi:hypothetical protein [Crossiella sp. CA198]|uniref:hypothetical protein n=1 Tax=Crossiella sp. CA198 TaxID=3455607 RepID=UPI003F8D5292